MIASEANHPKINFSIFLSEKLNYDYTYMANLFSSKEGMTIGRYSMEQRIEAVKQLLIQQNYTITEIAHKLNYSSVGHLSSQFRKITGLTPTKFKELHRNAQI